ncbi:PTS fructose transporter subunit IIC [Firmicutes bacterium AM29-6AC]|uniref:PTS fructose transporter subunit IIC n=1 Tax=Anaerotignum faecicola TaxID=2358141 RepID=A0A401LFM4_9FIRM|nr:fructose-specific PTS transporter subunit EIIC [Anaerotignum faecicola]RHR15363.1 PTS fructose transporter subunit IIC [Firmicutes bacterium AF19-2LB]RHT40697.1 PTS fructose transporter subunit IIC [Firmicutes bacterium AM29-6AC]GCB30292.1 PTS fructose transporter subunit IIC [Anaerotignum faecicola]
MRISELLQKESIALGRKPQDKADAIGQMVELLAKSGSLEDKKKFKQAILERERLSTTGIGEGIAIPHGKSSAVKRAALAAMVVPQGVDFASADGAPVHLLFMIAVPEEGAELHLEVLERLAAMLMDEDFRKRLTAAKDAAEFLHILSIEEEKRFAETAEKQEYDYDVLAVTACPTGIAHTFMAAESLENKAREMGITIKVETNGSGGAKNVLTAKEIRAAKGIIVAADKNVEMQRFYGKRVLQVPVADGIRKPEVLLGKILQGEAPVYGEGKDVEMADGREEVRGRGKKVYRDLMNGVSHMLPFVIGGGILIAVAFLLDDYSLNPANFGSNLPQAAFFKAIGDAAFGFMLPILAGYIAMGIADRPALAPGFVGGFLAKEGGSGFLGALLAGFAAGYLILLLKKLFDKLPRSLEGIKSILLYPVFGILLMGLLIQLIINPPVAWLNEALYGLLARLGTGSRVLLGVLLGGMMSVDMGGPINKAAYVFGTASLASNEFQIMAAVMAGGMVPPLALALAVFAFRDKFSEKERQSGVANLIMGACFITEGAIPFAAADPLRVLPACIIGSAVAGGLSMFFGCGLRAPHGGIFVLPVISHPFGFLAAVILGALVGMLLLGVLRKRIEPRES